MKVLGITGGVGAGKSAVLGYLAKKYQARIIQADQVAHFLMEPGQICYYGVVEAFGSGILSGDQRISRSKLGELVFQDTGKLQKLNRLIHPAVKAYIVSEIETEKETGKVPFVALEAALLLEDHYQLICDEIWYVSVPADIRLKRLVDTRGYTEEKARKIMKNQLSEEVFREQCQFVVDNSSDFIENTYEQIDRGLVEHEFL